jgi:hypothetical protein
MYFPKKYYSGLSKTRKKQRYTEIKKRSTISWKNPKAYLPFKTNSGVKSKKSQYTQKWNRLFPNSSSLEEKSKSTGVPLKYIKDCYNRGLAAWRTGHRPGATEQQWGYARVHSFLLCGKTYKTTDSDLVRKASNRSKKAAKWWKNHCSS